VAVSQEDSPLGWDIIHTDHLMGATATYIYGIVQAPQSPKASRIPPGVAGGLLPAVVPLARSLWLVLADVPLDVYGPGPLDAALRDMEWVGKIAVSHEAVVEHFARQPRVTVIPMKLFTMFSSRDRALADLRSRVSDIRLIAKRIAGCEEWGVRMTPTPGPSRARRPVAAATSGAAFLAAKKQARDTALEAGVATAAAADRAFKALAAIARDAARRDDAPEGAAAPPLLDAAFLVPSSRRVRFKAAARRLASETVKAGAEITITGPWPAYNFVQSGSRP
jgi:hypothetical protein